MLLVTTPEPPSSALARDCPRSPGGRGPHTAHRDRERQAPRRFDRTGTPAVFFEVRMGESGPDKDRVIEALVLAISHSALGDVAGTDALRSVLRVEYHDMVEGKVFDTEQLWELLAEQPGFDPEAAKPPLALFKTWESRLELDIKLPEAMAGMSDRERAMAASDCRVPPAELKLLFRMQTGETPREARPARATTQQPAANTSGRHEPVTARKPRPPWLAWVAVVFALGGFSFAGYSGYQYCSPGAQWSGFDKAALSPLPIKDASRLGDQVTASVDTAAWNDLDRDAQHKQLKIALMQLEDQGVKVISLTHGGKPIASVQRSRGGQLVFWPPK